MSILYEEIGGSRIGKRGLIMKVVKIIFGGK